VAISLTQSDLFHRLFAHAPVVDLEEAFLHAFVAEGDGERGDLGVQGEVHRQQADGRGEPIILKLAQWRAGDELPITVDHGRHRHLVQDGRNGVGEADVVRWGRPDAIVDADRLDGVQAVGRVTGLEVRHTRRRAHPQHRAQPRLGETVAQSQLLARGVEQAAHVGVGHAGLQAGLHHRQVGVVHGRIQAGVRALERTDQRSAVGDVYLVDGDLRVCDRLGHDAGLRQVRIGDHYLAHPPVTRQVLHRNAAHFSCTTQNKDSHVGFPSSRITHAGHGYSCS